MISSGIEYFRGGFGLLNPDADFCNLPRQETEHQYLDGLRGRNFFRVSSTQWLLSKLSGETGAESSSLSSGKANSSVCVSKRSSLTPNS
jgi:hypothetical protein